MALGLYFLLFLVGTNLEFSDSTARLKTILTTRPGDWEEENRGQLLKRLKAAWYSIPVVITIFGMFQWLATLG